MVRLNLGCGQIRPEGWISTDSSINSLIQQNILGRLLMRLLRRTTYKSSNARYMNLNIKWHRFANNSVDVVYASHLFEHLSLKSTKIFLSEAHRTLKQGAIIRLVVPDLYTNAKEYVEEIEKGNHEASKQFMWVLNLHREGQYPNGNLIHDLLGWFQGWPHQHKYMYDKHSLKNLLDEAGFRDISENTYGISKSINEISDVENPSIGGYGNSLYLEAIKK